MTGNARTKPCEQRIDRELEGRLSDLRRLWAADQSGKDDAEPGRLDDYGLCFDYVPPATFSDQAEAYFRYQLSWGGPSDEFRFFVNPDLSCHRIEYWFLDWFDGARREPDGDTRQFLLALWGWFNETGVARMAFEESSL